MPATGPRISSVEIETPFAIVVTRAGTATPNYLAPDAEEEFLGKPGSFRVHVRIDLTPSYSAVVTGEGGLSRRPDDFWRDFTIRLMQKEEVHPQAVQGQPLFDSAPDEDGTPVLSGAEVDLTYDPDKIDAASPLTVEVLTPDGQDVQTTFDLSQLR